MWIETFSGRRFDLLDPQPGQVDLGDMAHALARINRFTGHTDGDGYSVAEHSVWVWKLIERAEPENFLLQTEAVLHDGHEYVTGDISAPMKRAIEDVCAWHGIPTKESPVVHIERDVQAAIRAHFRLPPPVSITGELPEATKAVIKRADIQMLVTERHYRMPNTGRNVWDTEHIPPVLDLTVDYHGHTIRMGDEQPPDIWARLFRETVEHLVARVRLRGDGA